jgi:adenosylcobinamide-GDP ribazoletransferase
LLTVLNGLRLALTTYTIVRLSPVPVTRRNAAAAMLWGPAVGAFLGVFVALVLAAAREATGHLHPPVLEPALAVATLAWLTRGLHLDGLADTADGLGSGRPAAEAIAVMRQSDIGPFGVVTVMCTLLIQYGSIMACVIHGNGSVSVVAAVATGRLAATWACRVGIPAASPTGLGATVAGTVRRSGALLVTVGTVIAVGLGAGVLDDDASVASAVRSVGAVWMALLVALLVRRRCVRRLGGISGDVLGALVEIATTVTLLVSALRLP